MMGEKRIKVIFMVLAFGLAGVLACSRQAKKDEECETRDKVETPAKAQPKKSDSRVYIKKGTRQPVGEVDWCRACVVGPHGFMSCQRVNAASKDETREALRGRARIKACLDSGFTEESCPSESVIAIACKGDKPAADKTAAGKKVMKALKKSGPLVLSSDPKVTKKIKVDVNAKLDANSQKKEGAQKKAPEKAANE
jgi:hypothetical protein